MEILIVVDMQNDFIDGSLGTKEAVAIVPKVKALLESFDGTVFFTRDTHFENYLETAEGKNLPVEHCIKGAKGHEICDELIGYCKNPPIDKLSFGSTELSKMLYELSQKEEISSIKLVGLCTDICVISNALMIKAFLPEVPVSVDASCCAGVTAESHENALNAMKMCQIQIVSE